MELKHKNERKLFQLIKVAENCQCKYLKLKNCYPFEGVLNHGHKTNFGIVLRFLSKFLNLMNISIILIKE